MTADSQPQLRANKRNRISVCVGCGSQIHDKFILRVAPDLEWHAACLKCVDCKQSLDENCTCFVRDGKTYCRTDYTRLFGTKCSKCHQVCTKNDFVMRARDNMYHIGCFRCAICNKQLIPGDEFALRDDELFCKADHEGLESERDPTDLTEIKMETEENPVAEIDNGIETNNENGINKRKGRKEKSKTGESKRKSEQKPTRGRTVLNEKQLHTLCTWYNANPRPDALMKEQLVEMTNLSPRVIRVWFQNKRCKDNKRSILTKQIQQQEEKIVTRMCGPLHGVPMVASSPVRHESPTQMTPIEVQSYQQSQWQSFHPYPVKSEIEQPPLQQLMNSFDSMDSSSGHYNNSVYSDGYWGHPDYDNNTQFSDSDYNHDSRISSSPLSQ